MLDSRELQWLNSYHQKVRAELAPHLEGDALDWLMKRTALV
jgi:Xaa-Pro aminopeptidase